MDPTKPTTSVNPQKFRVLDVAVDPLKNSLVCDEKSVSVEPRIMSVLCLLAQQAPDVVTRDELISAVWGTDHGADDSVNQSISALRKALRQIGKADEYIQTVPKRGYRLVAAADMSEMPSPQLSTEIVTEKPTKQSTEKPPEISSNLRRFGLIAGLFVVVLSVTGISRHMLSPSKPQPNTQTQSIAVLPFSLMSSQDGDNFIAAGMHEALLTSLQRVNSLRVTSRTSSMQFRDSALTIPKIASELGVIWIVEGTVISEGNRLRISAKLIDADTDTQVWAEQYEGQANEILSLQSKVAASIADAIHIELTDDEANRLTEEGSVNLKAYSAYIRGLHHFDRITPADFDRSVELYRQAIALEPDFPLPYAALVVAHGIAVEYGWRTRSETRAEIHAAALTAKRLGPQYGEAHHALASFAFHYDRDFETAEREFKRAIDLNHDAYTYFSYGWLLSQLGRHAEAVGALEQAVELDPRSPAMHTDLGWWLYGSRDYEQAIVQARKALDIFDQHPEAFWLLAAAFSAKGQHEQANEAFNRYESLYGSPIYWFRGYLQALSGDQNKALQSADLLEQKIARDQALPIDAALIHAALGNTERALSIIEKSNEASVSFQPYLWPEYETLWYESRFQLALTRFSLPKPPTLAADL